MRNGPHILLVVSDQHNRKILGCNGDKVVRTPCLDRLAAAGVAFSQAYAPSPLCVPSRMAMLSSLMPDESGVQLNQHALPSHVPTVAHSLRAAGYRTVLCGRMHFVGPDQRHGYQERLVGDHTPTGVGCPEAPQGLYQGTTGQDGRDLAKSGAGWSSVQGFDGAVRDAAVARIRAQNPDEPLFLTVGFYGPHNPYVCTRERFDHYLAALPPAEPADLEAWLAQDHPAIRHWRETRRLSEASAVDMARARAAYYGACETVDALVGEVVDAADAALGAENLLIVYLSDHGDMAGERGMFWKSTFFEGSIGVPWILRWQGHLTPRRVDTPVSLLDVAPTLARIGGGPALPGARGQCLYDLLFAETPLPPRDLIATLADMRCGPSAMLRRGPWKLIAYHGQARPQLFNLAEDPGERLDRADDPACSGLVAELLQSLRESWDSARVQAVIDRARASQPLLRNPHPDPEDNREHWQVDVATVFLEED